MDEISRTIQFNPNQEAYKGFFCNEWKVSFLKMTQKSRLREPGFDLSRTWEAISEARQLPWLMVECLDMKTCETFEKFEPWDCKKIKIIGNKIIAGLEKRGERIRPMLRQKLQQAIKEYGEEIDSTRSQVAVQVLEKRGDLWGQLIAHNDFNTSLWGLERMCYGGLYFSYEWYLTQCLRLKRGEPKYRWRHGANCFTDFAASFGEALTESCLRDEEIQLARVTRNALAHNGGRITSELEGRRHTFHIEGEEIQINADHTTNLFHKLKDRVSELTQMAVGMSEVSATSAVKDKRNSRYDETAGVSEGE